MLGEESNTFQRRQQYAFMQTAVHVVEALRSAKLCRLFLIIFASYIVVETRKASLSSVIPNSIQVDKQNRVRSCLAGADRSAVPRQSCCEKKISEFPLQTFVYEAVS